MPSPSWVPQQRPIDMLTVTEQLRLDGKLDEVGGALRISELTGRVASAPTSSITPRIVAQKYLARELIEFSSEILNKAFDENQRRGRPHAGGRGKTL